MGFWGLFWGFWRGLGVGGFWVGWVQGSGGFVHGLRAGLGQGFELCFGLVLDLEADFPRSQEHPPPQVRQTRYVSEFTIRVPEVFRMGKIGSYWTGSSRKLFHYAAYI